MLVLEPKPVELEGRGSAPLIQADHHQQAAPEYPLTDPIEIAVSGDRNARVDEWPQDRDRPGRVAAGIGHRDGVGLRHEFVLGGG